jgi:hypothetical protein
MRIVDHSSEPGVSGKHLCASDCRGYNCVFYRLIITIMYLSYLLVVAGYVGKVAFRKPNLEMGNNKIVSTVALEQHSCQNFVFEPIEFNLGAGDFAAVLHVRSSSRPGDRESLEGVASAVGSYRSSGGRRSPTRTAGVWRALAPASPDQQRRLALRGGRLVEQEPPWLWQGRLRAGAAVVGQLTWSSRERGTRTDCVRQSVAQLLYCRWFRTEAGEWGQGRW